MSDEKPKSQSSAGDSSSVDVGALVDSVIERLVAKEFNEVVARFNDEFASKFVDGFPDTYRLYLQFEPASILGEHWHAVTSLYGPFDGIASIETQSSDETTVATATLQFQQQVQEFRLEVNSEGDIVGLDFPTQYDAPSYADPSQFEEREVTIETNDIDLGGTLTVPKTEDPVPGVVLLHGTGGLDRDYTAGPNKILKDLAWGLASHGIGCLRYDKRNFVTDVPDDQYDLETLVIEDGVAAVDRLTDADRIDSERVFVVGHSLGGMCSLFVAERHGGVTGIGNLDGVFAGSVADIFVGAVRGRWEQQDELSEYGRQQINRVEELSDQIETGAYAADESLIYGFPGRWWESFKDYNDDWQPTYEDLSLPLFFARNKRDAPQMAAHDVETFRERLPGESVEFHLYENLNHYFQSGVIPSSPLEPAKFRKPPAEPAIVDLAEWINNVAN